jgi:hypothetical protein
MDYAPMRKRIAKQKKDFTELMTFIAKLEVKLDKEIDKVVRVMNKAWCTSVGLGLRGQKT